MTNLNYLSRETLINIVLDLDYQLSQRASLEAQNLQIMLNKAYKDLEEMNLTRTYWKNKYLDLEAKAKESGLIKSQKRVSVKPEPKKEFTIKRASRPIVKIQKDDSTVEPVVENTVIIEEVVTPRVSSIGFKRENETDTKGNTKRTPHSSHKTKDTLLKVFFPKGTLTHKTEDTFKLFNRNIDAIDYIKKYAANDKMKTSNWTNISAAALGTANFKKSNGNYGGLNFTFVAKPETTSVDGVQIIMEENE